MKKSILALLVAALAFAVVAAGTGGASTKSHASAATALVTCGKTRTLGFMAPVTGPAADIGLEQVAWAKYYVARYNRTHSKKLKLQTEDTMLGAPTGTADALKGSQALAGNAKVLALSGPGARQHRLPGDRRPVLEGDRGPRGWLGRHCAAVLLGVNHQEVHARAELR